MNDIAQCMKAYIDTHPFDAGDYDHETVLDQLYMAYFESHEADPSEIKDAFAELNSFLDGLSLDDNNAVFGLTCRISIACERRGFLNGLQYGAHLMNEIFKEDAK